ncbi:hypothetical protein TNCV_599061 [Trichonephila clavipes]|nr:hypothetical protein TNCV_599061 [Trichonephila clavipes]
MKQCPVPSPNQLAFRICCGTETYIIRKKNTASLMRCPNLYSYHHSKRSCQLPILKEMQRSGRWANKLPLRSRMSSVNYICCLVALHGCRTMILAY